MRKIACFLLLLATCTLSAQINVLPADSAKTKEGILYSLPKTKLLIEIDAVKTIQKAGPYFRYCERYLGTTDMITEDKESWEITAVRIVPSTIADTAKSYKIIAAKNTQIPGILLTKKGIIDGINIREEKANTCIKSPLKPTTETPDISFKNNILTEDMILANSTAKIAEGIAKQIYRIRENRLSLITADVDHMPADGKSLELMLNNMNKTEKELMELFVGKTVKISTTQTIEYIPVGSVQNFVIARLSTINGLIPTNDLSGSPLYLNINAQKIELKAPVSTNKKELCFGLFYNIPGSAAISVTDGKKTFAEKDLTVAQFGSVQTLPVSLFKNNNLKIKFNTQTGAIESIEK